MMNRAVDLTVKQRLQRAIDRPLSADWPSELHRDVLAYIEQLETAVSMPHVCRRCGSHDVMPDPSPLGRDFG